MSFIYSASDIKKWDAFTIKHLPISSIELMEKAATLCTKKILGTYLFQSVHIVCGLGNNGGDGLVIARLLAQKGLKVTVSICHYSQERSEDFDTNLSRLPKNVSINNLKDGNPISISSDLIIDSLFGIGLNRPINGWLGNIIDTLNESKKPIVSIDIPSGLFPTDNSENTLKHIVQAHRTFSFQVPKMAFMYAEYAKFVGRFSIIKIGLLPEFKGQPIATYLQKETIKINERKTFNHKGNSGYLTVIAGSHNMLGAGLICAESGFRSGAGYVGVISHPSIISPLASRLPEAMYVGETADQLPKKTNAIAIGPGLGQKEENILLLKSILLSNLPLVIDADGINILANNPDLLDLLPKNTILTPHIGELKRLIGESSHPEEQLEKQIAFSIKHGIFIVQKGAYSKITTPRGNVLINASGNPYMATAGMGDALTGLIGGFLAQGYTPEEATKIGVYVHGLAGDMTIRKNGKHGLLTTDLIKMIPNALNAI